MGGQRIFCLALTTVLIPMISFSQVDDYSIVGESLWRNQGYGVENHYFQIENYVIPENASWFVPTDPVTAACPYEIYSTEEMPLYDFNLNALANTLKIRPYSDNDESDYRNGVSTLDLVAIQSHLLSSPAFESRTPTEDFPFRYISGDADYDHDVDEDDIDMIHDLILFYRDDFTRNSWEWVHKDEVEEAEERFEEEPYEFVIDYNWPGSEGIILSANSTNEIMGDNDKFFTFRSTKIGDITASSMSPVSLNDWVCGSGSYFTGGGPSSRTAGIVPIQKGSTIIVSMWLDNQDDIYGVEIPLYFQESELTLSKLSFEENLQIKWHRNPVRHSLVFSDFSRDNAPMSLPKGKLATLELKANCNIPDFNNVIRLYPGRYIEVIGKREEMLYPEVRLVLEEVIPPDFYADVRYDQQKGNYIFCQSPIDQRMDLSYYTIDGKWVRDEEVLINRGQSTTKLPIDLVHGLYLCVLKGSDTAIVKWRSQ